MKDVSKGGGGNHPEPVTRFPHNLCQPVDELALDDLRHHHVLLLPLLGFAGLAVDVGTMDSVEVMVEGLHCVEAVGLTSVIHFLVGDTGEGQTKAALHVEHLPVAEKHIVPQDDATVGLLSTSACFYIQ